MDLLQSFKQFIHQESLFSVNDRLILAVGVAGGFGGALRALPVCGVSLCDSACEF